jgi:hypothetical protein
MMYDPIAYTYDADYHCPECAEARFGRSVDRFIFGRSVDGFIAEGSEDSEGNPVGIVSPWDEWWEPSEDSCQALACGDCGAILDNAHREGCEENFGEGSCTLSEGPESKEG